MLKKRVKIEVSGREKRRTSEAKGSGNETARSADKKEKAPETPPATAPTPAGE